MTLKRVVIAMIATLALGGMSAFAAHLSVTTRTLGAGTTVVARCDPNAANWTYTSYTTNSNGQITGFTVGNIATTCEGGLLAATTTDASNGSVSSSSPISIPSGAGSCSTVCTQPVTLGTSEYPANLVNIHVVVTGP